MEIYLLRDGRQDGPYDESAVTEMLGRGEVPPNTLAWHEGLAAWKPVGSLFSPPPPDQVETATASPPPPPQTALAGDTILWEGRPSNLNYFGTWVLGLLFIAGGGVALVWGNPTVTLAALIAGGIGLVILVMISISRSRLRYTVTDRMVLIEVGLLIKNSDEIRIKDIRSIFVRKQGISGLFGVGNIEFSSAATDKGEIVFSGVARANHVRDLVRAHQAE